MKPRPDYARRLGETTDKPVVRRFEEGVDVVLVALLWLGWLGWVTVALTLIVHLWRFCTESTP